MIEKEMGNARIVKQINDSRIDREMMLEDQTKHCSNEDLKNNYIRIKINIECTIRYANFKEIKEIIIRGECKGEIWGSEAYPK